MSAIVQLRFPGGRKKAFTMSYDDGVEQDIRLIDIMQRNGLKGTFNLNSGLYSPEGTVFPEGTIHRRMSQSQVTALYAQSGMEVAVHGYEHPWLETLDEQECVYQIIKDRQVLEAQFGRIVRGMAYPFGTYSDRVVDVLRLCGIAYSRTVTSTRGFDLPSDWLRMPATCHHDDPMLEGITRKFLDGEPDKAPWLFYLWGHSYEFEKNDNWQRIEAFAAQIGGRDDVWYATNIKIHDYIEAFRSIHTSADCSRAYNPTAIDLVIEHDGDVYELPAGKEMAL